MTLLAPLRWLRIPSAYDAPLEIAVEEWIYIGKDGAPPFENNWVNYNSPDVGRDIGFYKDPLGVVHLKGVMKNGTVGQTAFTLPPGYRSEGVLNLAVASSSVFGLGVVNPSGTVLLQLGNNAWADFHSITFRAVPERQVV